MYDWKAIQQRLKDLGFYSGKVDGDRGPLTNQAIVAFKKSIGFVARDYYGPLTHEALMKIAHSTKEEPWMSEALLVKGLHERKNYTTLKQWFDKSVQWINPKEIPWCGAFVATCFRKWNPDIKLPENPLGARQWGAFGQPVSPRRGSVLTFWRGSPKGWQGHVGFYYAEDSSAYHVLGGNQSDAVTITRIAKNRLLQSRWPLEREVSGSVVFADASGKLSTNEA